MKLNKDNRQAFLRKNRHKIKTKGDIDRPRVCLYKGNSNLYVQVIDDNKGGTILGLFSKKYSGSKTNKILEMGKDLAKIMIEKGIKKAVLDSNGYKYHGIIKSLKESLNKGGINI